MDDVVINNIPYWGPGETAMASYTPRLKPGDLLVVFAPGVDSHDHYDSEGTHSPFPFLSRAGKWSHANATFERLSICMFLGTIITREYVKRADGVGVEHCRRYLVMLGGQKHCVLDFDHFAPIESVD